MQLHLANPDELPTRPRRSTSLSPDDGGSRQQPGDALLDSILTKADPAAHDDAQPVEAVLVEAREAAAQGQLALAATLFSRAFWRCCHEDPSALAIYLDMVQCRLLLGDGAFALDALHALQMWSSMQGAASDKASRSLVGRLLAKASCDLLQQVTRHLAAPHAPRLAEGTLRVQLLGASGLVPPGADEHGLPHPFVRLSLAGAQCKSSVQRGALDPSWALPLRSWWNAPSTLLGERPMRPPRASQGSQAAPAHPRAPPEQLGACRGLRSPPQAVPKSRIFRLQPPTPGCAR